MNHDPAYWPRKAEQYAAERDAALARVAELEAVAKAARTLADEPDRSKFEQHLALLEERVAALDATPTRKDNR